MSGAGGRVLLALASVVGLLAGCGGDDGIEVTGGVGDAPPSSVPAPTTGAPAPPTTSGCPAPGVRVTTGFTDAAMGLRVMGLVLTNCGAQPYTVSGYPAVTLLDEDRQPFEAVAVLHGPEPITSNTGYCTPTGEFDAGPQPVTIGPGEQAVSGLVWRNLTTDELDRLVNATYLSIAPTEADPPQVLTADGPIDLGTTGRVGVSAWAPRSEASACG
jgi:hypothetical protein